MIKKLMISWLLGYANNISPYRFLVLKSGDL